MYVFIYLPRWWVSCFVSLPPLLGAFLHLPAAACFKATLTGALDVVAVRYDDGHIECTPFHIRFGKWKLFHAQKRHIRVSVNGVRSELYMKVRRMVASVHACVC